MGANGADEPTAVRDTYSLTRRELLKAIGIGGSIASAGGAGLAAAQGTPGPSVPKIEFGYRKPGGPSVEQLAFQLEGDVQRIFEFVRDQVRYDAYPGALRGALGTLWGLAGNSVDQAQLLAAMLNHVKIKTRFVSGTLQDATASSLIDSVHVTVTAAQEHAAKVHAKQSTGDATSVAQELTPEQQKALDDLITRAQALTEDTKRQLSEGVDIIMTALSEAGVTLPTTGVALPEGEQSRHVWVQYAAGTEWVDLDPSISNAAPGTAYADSVETYDDLPQEWMHAISFTLSAEKIQGGKATKSELLTHSEYAQDLVGKSLVLVHLQPDSLKGLGAVIESALEGTVQYIPHLALGTNDVVPGTDRVTLVTDGGTTDAFGGERTNDGDTVSEWLEITITSPEMPDRHITREVFDRLGPELRNQPDADLSTFPTATLTDLGSQGGTVFLPLLALWSIVPTVGAVPMSYFDQDYSVVDLYGNLSLPGYSYHVARDGLSIAFADTGCPRVYANRPNLTAFLLTPTNFSEDRTEGEATIDLMFQSLADIPWSGIPAPNAPAAVVAGVLGQVAERLTLESTTGNEVVKPSTASVSALFEEVARQSIPVVALLPGKPVPSTVSLSNRARVLVTEALDSGYIVVVPEQPVSLGGEALTGWWQIDAATAETFDRMETGLGMTTLGYADTVKVSVQATPAMRLLSICLFAAGFLASMMLGAIFSGTALAAGAQGGLAAFALGGGVASLVGGGASGALVAAAC